MANKNNNVVKLGMVHSSPETMIASLLEMSSSRRTIWEYESKEMADKTADKLRKYINRHNLEIEVHKLEDCLIELVKGRGTSDLKNKRITCGIRVRENEYEELNSFLKSKEKLCYFTYKNSGEAAKGQNRIAQRITQECLMIETKLHDRDVYICKI